MSYVVYQIRTLLSMVCSLIRLPVEVFRGGIVTGQGVHNRAMPVSTPRTRVGPASQPGGTWWHPTRASRGMARLLGRCRGHSCSTSSPSSTTSVS